MVGGTQTLGTEVPFDSCCRSYGDHYYPICCHISVSSQRCRSRGNYYLLFGKAGRNGGGSNGHGSFYMHSVQGDFLEKFDMEPNENYLGLVLR
jgi:hypothetical protein